MVKIRTLQVPGYETVIEGIHEKAGLHAFIAIHSTTLGPSLGGVRIFPYSSPQEALQDCLRLAEAMTKKSAIAQVGLGGGKAVIIADPKTQKTPELLHAFGEIVNSLHGEYIAAEDVGSSTEDMLIILEKTRYVAALPLEMSSGDPSRFTAWGVLRGIEAVSRLLWKDDADLRGKTVAIQGLGSVGSKLADLLFWRGAQLIVSDVDEEKVRIAQRRFGAHAVPPHELIGVRCHIFSPCAMGGIINDKTIAALNCQAVAGSANNQLLTDQDGVELQKRGIFYAPDFVINAGGIINAASEFDGTYNAARARDKVDLIYDSLLDIFTKSQVEKRPTCEIANEVAEYNLQHKIGKRDIAIFS